MGELAGVETVVPVGADTEPEEPSSKTTVPVLIVSWRRPVVPLLTVMVPLFSIWYASHLLPVTVTSPALDVERIDTSDPDTVTTPSFRTPDIRTLLASLMSTVPLLWTSTIRRAPVE